DGTQAMLESEGYHVAAYASAEAFLADAARGRFRCLIVDLTLRGMDGLDLQSRLKSEERRAPIIFVTGSANLEMAVAAMREGAARLPAEAGAQQRPARKRQGRAGRCGQASR